MLEISCLKLSKLHLPTVGKEPAIQDGSSLPLPHIILFQVFEQRKELNVSLNQLQEALQNRSCACNGKVIP